jgi:hypothetical protein
LAGIRAGIAAFAAAWLIVPASAWACDEPHGSPDPVAAAPGDEVEFVIPTTHRGASYELSIEGRDEAVARGEDETDEPGTSGEFTVPDLGTEARRVDVVVHVTHEADGADWRWKMPLDYRGSDEAQPPPEAQPSATPAPPRPAPAPAARPRSAPPTVPIPSAAPTLLPPPPAPVSDEDRPSVGAVLDAVLPGLGDRGERRRRATPGDRGKARRRARRARRRANRVEVGRDPTPARGRDVEPPRDTRADLSDDRFAGFGYSVAWKLLAGVAAAGLLVPLLLGALARRRRLSWR